MYIYGYFVADEKIVIGTIGNDELEKKQREVNYANKIDPASRWFIEQQAVTSQQKENPHENIS